MKPLLFSYFAQSGMRKRRVGIRPANMIPEKEVPRNRKATNIAETQRANQSG